jgi:hypothetical protein
VSKKEGENNELCRSELNCVVQYCTVLYFILLYCILMY